MNDAISFTVAGVIATAVTVIGCGYLAFPERMVGSFGLRLPARDADTRAWLRLKGARDVGCGLLVLTLMVAADRRSLGVALLALAIIPLGDMSVVLGSRGSKASAFLIHGLTCAVMVAAGLALTRVI